MAQFRIFGPEASQSSFIEFGAVLAEVEYQFALQWLESVEYWELRITDPRRQDVLIGLRVTGGTDILQPFDDPGQLPPGQLIAYDTQGKFADPGRGDWIERHLLVYADPIVPPPQNFVRIVSENIAQ